MTQHDVKQEIGRFYNEVGWQMEQDGNFQNAQYEDLRPVSAEYIAQAHARAWRGTCQNGRCLLDAGSVRAVRRLLAVLGWLRASGVPGPVLRSPQAGARQIGERAAYMWSRILLICPSNPKPLTALFPCIPFITCRLMRSPAGLSGLVRPPDARRQHGHRGRLVRAQAQESDWTLLIRLAERLRQNAFPEAGGS